MNWILIVAACVGSFAVGIAVCPIVIRASGNMIVPNETAVLRSVGESYDLSTQRGRATAIMAKASHNYFFRNGRIRRWVMDAGSQEHVDYMISALEQDGYRIWRREDPATESFFPSGFSKTFAHPDQDGQNPRAPAVPHRWSGKMMNEVDDPQ